MSKENDIRKNVLERIRKGGVAMHSKSYFRSRRVLIGAAVLTAAALGLFALSFAFFSIHESGTDNLLGFGERGIGTFLALFPWLTLVVAFVFMSAVEYILHRFTQAYRFSVLRLFSWTIILGVAGSVLILFTPLHAALLSEADHDGLPFLGTWYEQVHDSHEAEGVYRGVVSATTSSSFTITHQDGDRDTDDHTWIVIPPTGFDLNALTLGDWAYIGGAVTNGVVHAYGIRIVSPRMR